MQLDQLRQRIDSIDRQIMMLLNDRMEQAVMIRKFKKQTFDADRERAVLDNVRSLAGRLVSPALAESLYSLIMEASRGLQDHQQTVVAFQGEHGAFSEAAALHWQEGAIPIPQQSFADIFDGLAAGTFDYGVVPVENSLGGIVGEVNNLLLKRQVVVVAALDMDISHCLMMVPGCDFRELRSVYSHPQALSQCREFIARNHLEAVPYYDTAGAAQMLARKQLKGAAAVAGRLAAELYGLDVVKEDIQGQGKSRTRFFVIQAADAAGKGTSLPNVGGGAPEVPGGSGQLTNKCSIVFSTQHKAGSLYQVLNLFAASGINLTRIESVPSDKAGEFAFFMDCVATPGDPALEAIFRQLEGSAMNLKVLGYYQEQRC